MLGRREVQGRVAQADRAVIGVAEQVDCAQVAVLRQRRGDLRDAVALGVQKNDLEAAVFVFARQQRVEQCCVFRDAAVDEDQFGRCRVRFPVGNLVGEQGKRRLGAVQNLVGVDDVLRIGSREDGVDAGQVGGQQDPWFQRLDNGSVSGLRGSLGALAHRCSLVFVLVASLPHGRTCPMTRRPAMDSDWQRRGLKIVGFSFR